MKKVVMLAIFCLLINATMGQTPTLVKDIFPLNGDGLNYSYGKYWSAVLGNKLVFQANNSTHGTELWVSDGTEAGTIMLKDITPGDRQSSSSLSDFFTQNEIAYFRTGRGLWRTNGTEIGTYIAWNENHDFRQTSYLATDTDLYFLRDGLGLLRKDSNGTKSTVVLGKHLSEDFVSFPVYGPKSVAWVNNKWFFIARDKRQNNILMVSDETRSGTHYLNTGVDGLTGSIKGARIERVGNQVFFVNDDGRNGPELWVTDGTQANTKMVKNITPGGAATSNLNLQRLFEALPNGLLFVANNSNQGSTVWFSDGTEAGTKPIKTPSGTNAFSAYIEYAYTSSTTGQVYFFYSQNLGHTIWRTNGTANGTKQVFQLPELDDFTRSSDVNKTPFFLAAHGFIYFLTRAFSSDGHNPCDVWRIDEKTGITSKAGRLTNCLSAPYFQIMGNHLYYIGGDNQTGSELWKLPLSLQGTKK